MRARGTIERREPPTFVGEDWVQIGVTRGLLLGLIYPALAGFIMGLVDGPGEALGTAAVFGLFGTLIGLLAGPLLGGLVGGIALVLDRRVTLDAGPRCIAALAILVAACTLSAIAAVATWATGNSLGETWGGLSFLVLAPSALGLVSLVVRPRIERPRVLGLSPSR